MLNPWRTKTLHDSGSEVKNTLEITTIRQRSCGKVMLSVVPVILCVCFWGGGTLPCDHCPWSIGAPHTGTPTTCSKSDLHEQDSPPPPQTCTNLFILKHVRLESERLASFWNTFLLLVTARKRSLGQGNVFTSVCQEFCPGGEVGGGEVYTPLGRPLSDTTGYSQQAGGTHPTGMHTCFSIKPRWLIVPRVPCHRNCHTKLVVFAPPPPATTKGNMRHQICNILR